ncbi:MAG: LemA family protein [bacterium]
MTATYIIIAVLVLLLLFVAVSYNGLIASRNQADEALSDIDVQMKRRYDLIPNLVESVKGYVKQEKSVLEEVTQARANAIAAGGQGLAEQQKAENMLTGALRSVFAVAENYPDLKSTANFQQLSSELTDTENKIEAARRFYNATVRDFNTKLQTLPTSLFASMLGFSKKDLFVLDEAAAKQPVKVEF